jgi:hypothetical protein
VSPLKTTVAELIKAKAMALLDEAFKSNAEARITAANEEDR